jgi:hypothetical protein
MISQFISISGLHSLPTSLEIIFIPKSALLIGIINSISRFMSLAHASPPYMADGYAPIAYGLGIHLDIVCVRISSRNYFQC